MSTKSPLHKNEILRITVPQYIRHIKLSDKRRPQYYLHNGPKPKAKKLLNTELYAYLPKKIGSKFVKVLTDLKTGEIVLKNPLAAGTPKIKTINGQGFYNQSVQKFTRDRMMSEIKRFFVPHVEKIKKLNEFPIRIMVELHDTILEPAAKKLWDLDNRFYPYQKAFQDVLTGNKDGSTRKPTTKQIIPDDNILFVTMPPSPLFIPVDTPEERKLVFIIIKETDPRIIGNATFQKLLKEQIDYESKLRSKF